MDNNLSDDAEDEYKTVGIMHHVIIISSLIYNLSQR
jgi:hypothetical protein